MAEPLESSHRGRSNNISEEVKTMRGKHIKRADPSKWELTVWTDSESLPRTELGPLNGGES